MTMITPSLHACRSTLEDPLVLEILPTGTIVQPTTASRCHVWTASVRSSPHLSPAVKIDRVHLRSPINRD